MATTLRPGGAQVVVRHVDDAHPARVDGESPSNRPAIQSPTGLSIAILPGSFIDLGDSPI